jgi:hypothetical protein
VRGGAGRGAVDDPSALGLRLWQVALGSSSARHLTRLSVHTMPITMLTPHLHFSRLPFPNACFRVSANRFASCAAAVCPFDVPLRCASSALLASSTVIVRLLQCVRPDRR